MLPTLNMAQPNRDPDWLIFRDHEVSVRRSSGMKRVHAEHVVAMEWAELRTAGLRRAYVKCLRRIATSRRVSHSRKPLVGPGNLASTAPARMGMLMAMVSIGNVRYSSREQRRCEEPEKAKLRCGPLPLSHLLLSLPSMLRADLDLVVEMSVLVASGPISVRLAEVDRVKQYCGRALDLTIMAMRSM